MMWQIESEIDPGPQLITFGLIVLYKTYGTHVINMINSYPW